MVSSHIHRFTKKSIIEAPNNSDVKSDAASQMQFKCYKDSNFYALWDESSIVGIRPNYVCIVKEDIINKSQEVTTYHEAIGALYTFVISQKANALLAGEENGDLGRIVQYDLHTGKAVRVYSSPGIETVFSSVRLDDLCFFGGFSGSSFIVIRIKGRRIVQDPVKTAVGMITSLELCTFCKETPDASTVLVVTGANCDYSNDQTDMFNVTELVTRFSHSNQRE